MDDYEKLGSFYLGKVFDLQAGKATDELMLYDSKDLVTHAVCVGMTGSGKTGLCISLIEEAAIDGVPSILIDPKGDLADLMLRDSGHIQEADAEFINKRNAREGQRGPKIEPLYTLDDAAHVGRLLQQKDYNVPFEVVDSVTAKLVDAGHVLGSSSVWMEVEEKGRKTRLWFSGDIGRRNICSYGHL